MALVNDWSPRRPFLGPRATLVPAPDSDDERVEAASFVAKLAAFKPDPRVVEAAPERCLTFRGGTLLAEAWLAVHRFSENIT